MPPKSVGLAPLRAIRTVKLDLKRPDPRDIGRGSGKGRPTGGRLPRFPGRIGGR